MALDVSPVTPLDPRERRDEWQEVATVLLALWLTGGVVGEDRRPAAGAPARSVDAAAPRHVRGRPVRPPRSC